MSTQLQTSDIPSDFPVKPLEPTEEAVVRATCGTCCLSWDDGISTSLTPTPSARCPFEQFHKPTGKHKRSGMSVERADRLQNKLKDRIQNIFSSAWHFHHTHSHMVAQLSAIYQSSDWLKAPTRVQSYLRGWVDAKWEEVWHSKIEWMLWCDGKLMSSKQVDELTAQEKAEGKDTTPDYRSPWARIDLTLSRHVWKDASGNPLPLAPFTHFSLSRLAVVVKE